MNPLKIETVTIVTMEHGEAFAKDWYEDDGMAQASSDTAS
jgi:hypothetical protein